jgi:RNA polymerase sigma-70 factor, ECF subfamily
MLNPFKFGTKNRSRPPNRDADDAALMARVGEGCRDSWLALFQRYEPLAFHIALCIVKDRGEAEEAVQQLFFDLFRAHEQFDSRKGSFKSWLVRYAYSRARDQRRKLKSLGFYDLRSLDNLEDDVEGPQPVLGLTAQEVECLKDELFSTLNDTERKVCELRLIRGFTMKEVVRQTGESGPVVRRHFDAGRAKLRAAFLGKENRQK